MAAIFYKTVKGALDSLSMSTSRRISLRDETVEFSGLNSPYISHQNIQVGYGHNIPGLVILANDNVAVAAKIGPLKFKGNFMEGVLPAFHLRRLFQFPASPPDWLGGPIETGIIDSFLRFEEGGEPVFADSAEFSVEYTDRWGDKRERVIDSFDYRPKVGNIIIDIPKRRLIWGEESATFGFDFKFPGTDEEYEQVSDELDRKGYSLTTCNHEGACPRPDNPECTGCEWNIEPSGNCIVLPKREDD